MSLKAEIETWVEALKAYDDEDFEKALDLFQRIADNSKIFTNIGLIYATLGEHELAVDSFNNATNLDQFLAVAYFQCGVSNFLMNRFDLAYKDFEEAHLYLRGNQSIKYEQLGLKFSLYSAEVLFNRGLAQMNLNRVEEGLVDMTAASKEKITPEHDVIEDCIRDQGEGYTVFSIPVGVLYRPAENKVKNTKAKDYLGKAKLVAATDAQDMGTGFAGADRLARGVTPSGAPLERPRVDERRPAAALVDLPPPRLERAPTQIKPAAPSAGATAGAAPSRSNSAGSGGAAAGLARGASIAGAPVRGLSVRARAPPADAAGPPVPGKASPPGRGPPQTRLTEIYDDYMGAYDEPAPPLPGPPPTDANARVANWAQKVPLPGSTGGSNPSSRANSVRAGGPAPSVGGGAPRRRPTRRQTQMTGARGYGSARASTAYEEEEEGYGSAEYDEGFELVKIRVKVHYRDDVRGMAMTPDTPYDEFLERVTSKFGRALTGLAIRFRDEDGAMVSLKDDSDFELAIETARESAKGKPEGKLELWCDDA